MALAEPLYGGIELGGTKTTWGIATDASRPTARGTFATSGAAETIANAAAAISDAAGGRELAAIGVGAFGPIDLASGVVGNTPKDGWRGAAISEALAGLLPVPLGLDTDVNAAALGELHHGAARGASNIVYVTVGTGIGGGAVIAGQLVHGGGHPEMGHVTAVPHAGDLDEGFAGICPFHGGCLEGMASGRAIAARFGTPAGELAPEHPAWEREAHYIGSALADVALQYRPQRIILGGGVLHAPGLRELIRRRALDTLNGYIDVGDASTLVTAPGLGELSGLVGALVLAQEASARSRKGDER
ncbi:MAG: ROK family protein [Solirubrobacteraceae bacterium]